MKHIAACSTLFLFLLFLLCSCSTMDPSDYIPISSDRQEETVETTAFAKKICLILPEDASPSFYQKAEELGRALEGQTGLSWYLITDAGEHHISSDEALVILGWANHPLRVLHTEALKKNDYICVGSENLLIIGALTDEVAMQAIDRYISVGLPYASSTCLMPEDKGFSQIEDYSVGVVTLNGTPLYHWTIVCEDDALQIYAEQLQKEIQEKSGYTLPIVKSSVEHSDEYILSLGWEAQTDSSDFHACISLTSEGIRLSGTNLFDISTSIRQFVSLLFSDPDENGMCQATLSEDIYIKTERSQYRIGLALLETYPEDVSDIEMITNITDQIYGTSVDAVFFASDDVKDYISQILKPIWQELPTETPGTVMFQCGDVIKESIVSSAEGIYGIYQIGGSGGGFLWVIASPHAVLPPQLTDSSLPVVVTVFGKDMVTDMNGFTHIRTETRQIDGAELNIQCFATPGAVAVTSSEHQRGDSYWGLSIERMQ